MVQEPTAVNLLYKHEGKTGFKTACVAPADLDSSLHIATERSMQSIQKHPMGLQMQSTKDSQSAGRASLCQQTRN